MDAQFLIIVFELAAHGYSRMHGLDLVSIEEPDRCAKSVVSWTRTLGGRAELTHSLGVPSGVPMYHKKSNGVDVDSNKPSTF